MIENFRDEAPPEILPEEIRMLDEYQETVEDLDYSEVAFGTLPFARESSRERRRRKKREKERREKRMEDFQNRIDSYTEISEGIETVLE